MYNFQFFETQNSSNYVDSYNYNNYIIKHNIKLLKMSVNTNLKSFNYRYSMFCLIYSIINIYNIAFIHYMDLTNYS